MIAYHFPPLAGSSGIQRTLRFVQHLPSLGWQPLVLTAHPWAYERTGDDLLGDVPVGTVVRHAYALDTARHLQIAGRYLGWMARPDRWVSWQFDAIRQGLKMIKEFKPDVIWSTYPIATAHKIASALHRKTGIPWVADFRDPMAHDGFPPDPRTWQSYLSIEAEVVAQARMCMFTTPGAARMYQQRYPAAASRMVVLENGYDEESFLAATQMPKATNSVGAGPQPLVMLHSGVVYPSERDPTQLFVALGQLHTAGALHPSELRIRFRDSKHDHYLKELALAHGAHDFIEVCPAIPYREALAEMMTVDALLILQASNCNDQIPAKVYEYLRAGKPILALTDPSGDTAHALGMAGVREVVRLDSADDIARALQVSVSNWQCGTGDLPIELVVRQASRRIRTEAFVAALEQVTRSAEGNCNGPR